MINSRKRNCSFPIWELIYHHFRFIRFEKATSYPLAVRSDCYVYTADENLRINPQSEAKKKSGAVKIKLDPKYYGNIDGLDKRFADGIPFLGIAIL